MIEIIKRGIIHPVIDLLKQGVTPEKISLSIALGGTVGIFPVIGTTSLFCGLLSYFLRLNMIAIQAVNYAVYPVQILMLVPFVRLGESISGSEPFPISTDAIIAMLKLGLIPTVRYFWEATINGIMGWAVISTPSAFLVYIIIVPILRKTAEKYKNLRKTEKG